MKKLLISNILLLMSVSVITASNFYVRPNGGTYGFENGSDWTNAFDGFAGILWGSVGPGDTIYLAGGSYTQVLEIHNSGTFTNRIIIKRATTKSHGTNTGWSAGFDSQVVLDGVSITIRNQNYITIDGMVENGIYIDFSSGEKGHLINLTPGNEFPTNYITLRYIKAQGPGINLGEGFSNTEGLHSAGTPTPGSNLTVQHCEFFNFPGGIMRIDVVDALIEYNKIHDCADTVNHEDYIITYDGGGIIRYNICWNTEGAGFAFNYGARPWYVYGNIFYATPGFDGGNAIELQRPSEVYVFNNTFVGSFTGVDASTRAGEFDNKGAAYNNLFYSNVRNLIDGPFFKHDYNWYYPLSSGDDINGEPHGILGTDDPFQNSTQFDFRLAPNDLKSPIDTGSDLGSPYNVDLIGTPRPQGKGWDMGAYEYFDPAQRYKPASGLKIKVE